MCKFEVTGRMTVGADWCAMDFAFQVEAHDQVDAESRVRLALIHHEHLAVDVKVWRVSEVVERPDYLSQALNEGDGVYRP